MCSRLDLANDNLQRKTPVLKRELCKPKLFKLRLGDRLREFEVAPVRILCSLDIVSNIYLARDACKISGATHQRMFAVPVDLGTIRCELGGELIRGAESTACRSVG